MEATAIEITDEDRRKLVLSHEGLYLLAREFGGGNDNDMYDKLAEFIELNRGLIDWTIKTTRGL